MYLRDLAVTMPQDMWEGLKELNFELVKQNSLQLLENVKFRLENNL